MSAFIVSGGSLLEIGCPSTLSRNTEQQVSFTRTLGGKRKGFIRKGGRRAWSVDVSAARPGEVSTIEAVARQMGPVGWYPPEAVIGNLLSPQASSFESVPEGATAAGLVQLPDGTVGRTVVSSGTVRPGGVSGTFERVPVTANRAVSVGVWSRGTSRFTALWRDSTGAMLGAVNTTTLGAGTGWQWLTATFTPPPGAAFIESQMFQGAQYARPSVSWGTASRDELGTGCPQALIHSPSHTPVALWQGTNYTDSSYTVTEVG